MKLGRATRALLLTILGVGCLMATVTAASAQSGLNRNKPQSDDSQRHGDASDGALKLNTTVVNMAVVATDHGGRYIPGLKKEDFELFENGAKQEIAFFGDEEVPFNVALLMDVSQSVSNSLKDIKKAATDFVRQLRPNDRVMVVAFDQQVLYLTDFTNDRKRLESAINQLQTGHGTSVYEAVYDTVATRFRGIEGRKAMLLLSDGEDTTSKKVGFDDTVSRVAESDVLVYGLRYPDTGGVRHGGGGWGRGGGHHRFPFSSLLTGPMNPLSAADFSEQFPQFPRGGGQRGQGRRRRVDDRDFMKEVTDAAGGPLYDAKTVGDLSKLTKQIADELRHVYVIGYYPSKPLADGGYRSVQIRVKGRDDIALRHRRGYDAHQGTGQPAS